MDAIERFKARREERLNKRGYRKDDEEETGNNGGNNGGNKGGNKGGGGGHGNTRLPYGLCMKYGIEIGKDWSPRDAWGALADKGVTPAGEFSKRGGKKTTIKHGSATYTNVGVKKYGSTYSIVGDMEQFGKKSTGSTFAYFGNKDEMFACLKEYGVNSVKDPDTGETVNPMEMDLPKTVAKKGEKRFTELVLGTRTSKGGAPYSDRSFTLFAKDFDGKKIQMGDFKNEGEALKYAKETLGCKDEDLKRSRDYKKWKESGVTVEEEREERRRKGAEMARARMGH